jgi:RNA-directed DNA polymerase
VNQIVLHTGGSAWYLRLDNKSRMSREVPVRFREGLRVKLPRPTRLVMGFENEDDARRVMEVLPKRMGRFGLSLNMEKTRKVDFRKPDGTGSKPETFDFLGFTHYWGKSRKGQPAHKLKTAKDRLARSCRAVAIWCRKNLHKPVEDQCRQLNWKLRGHYGYYGLTHNIGALREYYLQVRRIWHEWLNRRGNQKRLIWERYQGLLTRHPLITPRIIHSLYASCERSV